MMMKSFHIQAENTEFFKLKKNKLKRMITKFGCS